MSDYFAALMRSAGTAMDGPSGKQAREAGPVPKQPAESPFEIEQHVELEDALEHPVVQRPDEPADARFAAAIATSREQDEVTEPGAPAAAAAIPAVPRAPEPPDRGNPTRDPIELALTARVHPAVRAALDWVRADPGPRTDPRVVRTSDAPVVPEVANAPGMLQENQNHGELGELATASLQQADVRQNPSRVVARVINRATERSTGLADLDSAETLEPREWSDRGRSRATERDVVELSIGSIHVTIDPRLAPAAVAAPQFTPPQTPVPAPRSADAQSFARLRLPRL